MATWAPTPFNLLNGNPFELEQLDAMSSSTTGIETQLRAFDTGIRERDAGKCIVCGSSQERI